MAPISVVLLPVDNAILSNGRFIPSLYLLSPISQHPVYSVGNTLDLMVSPSKDYPEMMPTEFFTNAEVVAVDENRQGICVFCLEPLARSR